MEHKTYSELVKTELVLALACAVGTDNSIVIESMEEQLKDFGYKAKLIKISKELLEPALKETITSPRERIDKLMDKGNDMREMARDSAILAQGVAHLIRKKREDEKNSLADGGDIEPPGVAYIVDSLKHGEEVNKLREIYHSNFYLFAINESESDRKDYLAQIKDIGPQSAQELINRDTSESDTYGQHTRDVFELADFHLTFEGWKGRLASKEYTYDVRDYDKTIRKTKKELISKQMARIFDVMFGAPFITPTFEEYAMFMAYSSSLRSADLSRQVGAVIATKNNEIIATGANDVPQYGGGQYWQEMPANGPLWDKEGGRDYMLGYDPNKRECELLVNSIVDGFCYSDFKGNVQEYKVLLKQNLLESRIKDLTEYNRAVHAEMAAMLSCARTGVSLQGATLYCSTFPCHNCTRHAIYAGIERIIFVEPYAKSKALELHGDSTTVRGENNKVKFISFTGIGPRRFFDFFSLKLGTGRDIIRKEKTGSIVAWKRNEARPRCQLSVVAYIEKEQFEAAKYQGFCDTCRTIDQNPQGNN